MSVTVAVPITTRCVIGGASRHEHDRMAFVFGCPIYSHRLYFVHHHVAGRRRRLADINVDLLGVCRGGT